MNAFLITIGTVLALVLGDFLLGVIISIKAESFDVRKIPQFLWTGVLYYVGSLLVLAGTACLAGEYSTVVWGIFAAAALATAGKYLADIKDKILQIFGAMDIPETVNVNKLNDDLIIKIKEAMLEVLHKTTSA